MGVTCKRSAAGAAGSVVLLAQEKTKKKGTPGYASAHIHGTRLSKTGGSPAFEAAPKAKKGNRLPAIRQW